MMGPKAWDILLLGPNGKGERERDIERDIERDFQVKGKEPCQSGGVGNTYVRTLPLCARDLQRTERGGSVKLNLDKTREQSLSRRKGSMEETKGEEMESASWKQSEEGLMNDKKQIFILSGQSNMAGRGGVSVTPHKKWDGVVPPECRPDPSILRLNAGLQWEEAHEPLHADIDNKKVCGVGPGMSFANAIRSRGLNVGVIGLVPCAVGGTAIKQWERGQHLYEKMVRRANESVKEGSGEIRAVVWYQGESDTSSQHDAHSYKANMEKLIRDVRSDLNSPCLPFIQVAIASGDGRFIERVREAQLGINLNNVICVDAQGLPLKEDNLHLTTEAQVQLGNMLADGYLTHFASIATCPTPTT